MCLTQNTRVWHSTKIVCFACVMMWENVPTLNLLPFIIETGRIIILYCSNTIDLSVAPKSWNFNLHLCHDPTFDNVSYKLCPSSVICMCITISIVINLNDFDRFCLKIFDEDRVFCVCNSVRRFYCFDSMDD